MERWRKIKGFDNYKISSKGQVKSFKNLQPKILSSCIGAHKYKQVSLQNNQGIAKTKLVHQLVAMAFLGHSPDGHGSIVTHINKDPLDNKVENLRIVSHRETTARSVKGSSKYRGVYLNKPTGMFMASLRHKGKSIYLGLYRTEKGASAAYKRKVQELSK